MAIIIQNSRLIQRVTNFFRSEPTELQRIQSKLA